MYWKQDEACSIYTNKGEEIVVSECDYDYLSASIWHITNHGLVARAWKVSDSLWIPKTLILMARLLNGYPPAHIRIFHRNRDKLDCRRSNMIAAEAKLTQAWTHEKKIIPEYNGWQPQDWEKILVDMREVNEITI